MGAPGAATLQANRPPLLPGKLRGPWKVARLEMVRSAHMRKLQLAVERPFSGWAVICRPALLSGQTGNGLSCEGLRSRVVENGYPASEQAPAPARKTTRAVEGGKARDDPLGPYAQA